MVFRRYRKYISIILLLFFGSPLSAQQEIEVPLEKITLQHRWKYEFQFSGFIAAKELGFYREVGLDVELKDLTYGKDVFEELRSDRAQYAIGTSNTLVERDKGTPLVILAVIFQHSPFVIISRTDAEILNPIDLVRHKISVYEHTSTILMAMLKREGVESTEIEYIKYDEDYSRLINGEVDATTAMVTLQPYAFDQIGLDYTIMRPQTYGIDFYGNSIITLESEVNEHPERVKAFREASLRGWNYAMQNKDEIIDIMLDKYNAGISRELLRYEADAMDDIMYPELIEIGHMNPGRWQHIADVYKELDMIDQNFSVEDMLYDPSPETDLSGMIRLLKILGTSLFLISTITLVLVIFYRRLQKAEKDKQHTIEKLQNALSEIKTLREMLPICASCKKIRNDDGYWENVEEYISKHTDSQFSHGLCPGCMEKLYPELAKRISEEEKDKSSD